VEHIDETDRRIDRISEELSAKTKILATDLLSHVELTDNDIEAVRNHVTQVKVQMVNGGKCVFILQSTLRDTNISTRFLSYYI